MYYIRNVTSNFAPDTYWKVNPDNIGASQVFEAKINVKFIALFKDDIHNEVVDVPALILNLLPVDFFQSLKFKTSSISIQLSALTILLYILSLFYILM